MDRIQELEKLWEQHVKARDEHQSEISKICKEIQELKAGDFNETLKKCRWILRYDFFNYSGNCNYFLITSDKYLNYFTDKTSSIVLEGGFLTKNFMDDSAKIMFNKIEDINPFIEKYQLNVDRSFAKNKIEEYKQLLGD